MQKNCHLGLSFTERFFQIAEVKRHNGKYYISCLDEIENKLDYDIEELPDLIYRPDFILEIITNLKDLLRRNNLKSQSISFALDSNSFFITRIPVDPVLNSEEVNEHLRWEISSAFPLSSPESFHIISSVLRDSPEYKELLVVVIRKDIVRFFKDIFKKLKLNLSIFEVEHFAAISSFIFNYPEFSSGRVDLLKIGNRTYEISSIGQSKVNGFVKYRLEDKFNLGEKLHGNDHPVLENVYCFGREVDGPIFRNIKKEIQGVNMEICNPFRKLEISSELSRRQEFMLNRSSFASSVGLALRKVQ